MDNAHATVKEIVKMISNDMKLHIYFKGCHENLFMINQTQSWVFQNIVVMHPRV